MRAAVLCVVVLVLAGLVGDVQGRRGRARSRTKSKVPPEGVKTASNLTCCL